MTESTTTPVTEWNGNPHSETWEIPLSVCLPSGIAPPVTSNRDDFSRSSRLTQTWEIPLTVCPPSGISHFETEGEIMSPLASGSSLTQELEPRSKLVSVRSFTSEQEEVTLLEKWEGHVIEILKDTFRARVRNNLSDLQAVEAEFALEELPEEFHSILSEGMPVVWSIVRERRKGGIQRSSILYLRRCPRESESSIKSARSHLMGGLATMNRPPEPDEVEVSLFGPGFGECVLVHLGNNQWMVVDCCLELSSGRPAPIHYLEQLGCDIEQAVCLVVATHWHDDHMEGSQR